ncbi:NAD(+)/NADH kinase [Maridesulfovibrio hydrothermalis]|uniref:NAD kinase n=1 Tax=Maridesulfovibrio hydrothermalis AM13 = DSM 14728 TaxID=1121451 RepID=L0RCT3_9BACT|nr:NAD(+)/NADH kinase [Maridesulfovibrio hydrothermalis]CCO23995.1 putative inorganic polyphosphate/ATP-NAD kinase [Maridesulfovibrio hydrothermalis AM13 = DSM 14728]
MSDSQGSVLIVTKSGGGAATELGNEISGWLSARGVRSITVEHPFPPARVNVSEYRENCKLVLVLGGDGTFISTAGVVIDWEVPVLGINHGRVGFLAEVVPEEWETALERFFSNELDISRRTAFEYEIQRGNGIVARGVAVNDLVISRGAVARIISLDISQKGQCIENIRADGLIIATPTGSTAYNVSAGGPLVHPELSVMCITPVCPFLNGIRPMVLPAERQLSIDIAESSGDVYITEDGRVPYPLNKGYRVTIKRHKKDLMLARIRSNTFFQKLRSKGFLTE